MFMDTRIRMICSFIRYSSTKLSLHHDKLHEGKFRAQIYAFISLSVTYNNGPILEAAIGARNRIGTK
jgi:hypothetical protein